MKRELYIRPQDFEILEIDKRVNSSPDGFAIPCEDGDYVISAVYADMIWVEFEPLRKDAEALSFFEETRPEITDNGLDEKERISDMDKTDADGGQSFWIARPLEPLAIDTRVTMQTWNDEDIAIRASDGEFVVFDHYEDGRVCLMKYKKPEEKRGLVMLGEPRYSFGRPCGRSSKVDVIGPDELTQLREQRK